MPVDNILDQILPENQDGQIEKGKVVFAGRASYDRVGVASFDDYTFLVENGHVKISKNYIEVQGITYVTIIPASDSQTTEIDFTYAHNTDMTYMADNISSVIVRVPAEISHGFYGGMNFKTGKIPPTITFTNPSRFPLALVWGGVSTQEYKPNAEVVVNLLAYCDGMRFYIYIGETF